MHTSWSVDAWLFGNHLTGPGDALKYAQGETIKHPLGYDIKIEQPLPPELQGRDLTRGESDLKGHIKGNEEDDEGSGSIAYVPPEAKDALQLQEALALLRGQKTSEAFPPDPNKTVLQR